MYLQQVNPRVCTGCPPGTMGRNGLYCEQCKGLRVSIPSQDNCVCHATAEWIPSGACACPPGYTLAVDRTECVQCPTATVRPSQLLLSDTLDQPSDLVGCDECPPGLTSDTGATSCYPCATGKYREAGQSDCHQCAGDNPSYATDPTQGSSCVACQAQCDVGFRAAPCPIDDTLFACQACPPLIAPQEWVSSFATRNCNWKCPSGYYIGDSGCMACTTPVCQDGFTARPCSTYADAVCDQECFNATMPLQNAHFLPGCTWACDDGYTEIDTAYTGWVEYSCV